MGWIGVRKTGRQRVRFWALQNLQGEELEWEVRWVRDAEHREMQKENKGEKVARRNGSKGHRK